MVSLVILFSNNLSFGQGYKDDEIAVKSALNVFKFRSIGPAFMSGRIADIAIDPTNENVWYVAVGSGGVGKPKMQALPGVQLLIICLFTLLDVLQ